MGQVACMGEMKDVYKTLFRNNGREHTVFWETLGIDV